MPSAFTKDELLSAPVRHIDIKQLNIVPLIDQMSDTAFQARNLARAATILDLMQQDKECAVILTLAGSLISARHRAAIASSWEQQAPTSRFALMVRLSRRAPLSSS